MSASTTRMRLLYVSATYSLPPRATTPRGCWKRAREPTPSSAPKSNSEDPDPATVATLPSGCTTRIELLSESAKNTRPLSSIESPLGCASSASAGGPSAVPSLPLPATGFRAPVCRSSTQIWWDPAIAIKRPSPASATSHGELIAVDGTEAGLRIAARLLSRARHRDDGSRLQVDAPDRVVARVGDVHEAAGRIDREPLRVAERRLRDRAVLEAREAAADDLEHAAARFVDRYDAVVIGVRDEEPPPGGVDAHLSGVGEHRLGQPFALAPQRERPPVELALRIELLDERGDDLVEAGVEALALVPAHRVARGVDDHERGPRLDLPQPPDRELAVVDHRMLEIVAQEHLPDVLRSALFRELRGVHPDDDQLVREVRLQPFEPGEVVDAVDAPVGPEVEHDHLAAQLGQRERRCRVQPFEARRKLRRRRVAGPRPLAGLRGLRRCGCRLRGGRASAQDDSQRPGRAGDREDPGVQGRLL